MAPKRTAIELTATDAMPPSSSFSWAVGADGLIWSAGHVAREQGGAIVAPGDLVGQFRQTLGNLAATLEQAGSGPEEILKLTYFVTDVPAFRAGAAEIEGLIAEFLGGHLPSASLVGVTELVAPDAMVEIECVARKAS